MYKKNKLESFNAILKENSLTGDSYLYRYTKQKYIQHDENGDVYILAKEAPEEIIVDNYEGQGHAKMANDIGYGLAFTTQIEKDYNLNEKVCIKIQLNEITKQGGLIYPVTSVPEYINSFLLTIPLGKVLIEIVEN